MEKPKLLKKKEEFSADELNEIRKTPSRVRDGKAIIGRVEVKHPGKPLERWLCLEDGTEIFEDETGKTLKKFSPAPQRKKGKK